MAAGRDAEPRGGGSGGASPSLAGRSVPKAPCVLWEKAEQAIWNRLQHLKALKARRPQARAPLRVGILGCVAERLKEEILHREKLVDVVAGPDAYCDLSVLKSLLV